MFLALKSLALQPGDEVITTPMTFVATANCIVHAGGKVVFADIEPDTLNICPLEIEKRITPKTKAILPVHIGGNACRMDAIMDLAYQHSLEVIEDCAHALEGEFAGKPLGTFGMAGAYSFYATKNITTGEGGMISCRDEELEKLMRRLSRHGLDKGAWQRMEVEGQPLYDVAVPGFKCNMSDISAAIGLAQMDKLDSMYARRQEIYAEYEAAFSKLETIDRVKITENSKPALHLYQLVLNPDKMSISRDALIQKARERGVELSVNYTPIHLFSWYRQAFCSVPGAFPNVEYVGMNNISLPFYPALSDEDVAYVIEVLSDLLH